jgi:rod shape-determining protein MreD
VINEAGVLGQVTRVYPLTSEVTLLTDKDAAIPVLNTRTQQRSAAFGGAPGGGGMELRFMSATPTCRWATRWSPAAGRRLPAGPAGGHGGQRRAARETGFARILLEPAARADGVRHVLVLEPVAAQAAAAPAAAAPPRSPSAAGPAGTVRCACRRQGGGAMIMPRGDQLLLPVNPLFIGFTLLVALGFNLLPLGRQPALPDLLAVVLVFWNVHQPRRVGVGVAFVFGLLMDVHEGALLGQHALAYTLLSFVAITIHRRLLWFGLPSRRCRSCRCSLAAHVVSLVVRMVAGGMFPGWCCCWRRCSRPCCGRWSRCCCWRRSAARPTRTRIGRCDASRAP